MSIPSILLGSGIIIYLLNQIAHSDKKTPKFNVKETRDINGLTQETVDLINLITTEANIEPVGSFRYKAHRYPGDVDIMENLKACCTAETASKEIAKRIQKIAQDIKNKRHVYLGDFKAGLDERYNIDIGQIINNELYDYDPTQIRKDLITLYNKKLLTEPDFRRLLSLVIPEPTPKEYDELREAIREFYIVRWNLDEILRGYKMLPHKYKLELSQALRQDSVVKIDVWGKVDGKFTEVTNFFLIVAIDENGNQTILNKPIGDREANLEAEILKFQTNDYRNSLKLAKRLWSRALLNNDTDTLNKLYPLFNNDVANLNQIVSESEVIIGMLEKLARPPLTDIMEQLDSFKRQINDASFKLTFQTGPLYVIINHILREYQKNGIKIDRLFVIENLYILIDSLNKVIEAASADFLSSISIDY